MYFTMMSSIKFTKMHGLGNDFVVIDDLGTPLNQAWTEVRDDGLSRRGLGHVPLLDDHSSAVTPSFARSICDRRFGVGADQVLWLRKPHDDSLDVRMEILNSDGSVAEMCGNGIRAIALYMDRRYKKRNDRYKGKHEGKSHDEPSDKRHGGELDTTELSEFRVETLAGVKTVKVRGDQVAVDMGLAQLGAGFAGADGNAGVDKYAGFSGADGNAGGGVTGVKNAGKIMELNGKEYRFYEVNVGNPHAVFFVEDVARFPVEELGPLVERHPFFPNRTNVEFVQVLNPHAIRVRVWERGAGITLACGTGACASAVASLATGRTDGEVDVELPGGHLKISWNGLSAPIMMEGAATEVFEGIYFI